MGQPALNRFFSLHYLLPFVILGLVIVHIWAFHTTGNNNPTGVEVRRTSKEEAEKRHPALLALLRHQGPLRAGVILAVFFAVVGFMPNYLGHPDNYIEANAACDAVAHRAGMVLPAVLRDPARLHGRCLGRDQLTRASITGGIIDAKFFGVLAMFGAIVVLALAPWLDTSSVRSGRYRPMFKWWFYLLCRRLHRADVGRRHAGRGHLPL